MRCFTKGWFLPAVILAGCLATGCGSAAQSALSNLPSKTARSPPRRAYPPPGRDRHRDGAHDGHGYGDDHGAAYRDGHGDRDRTATATTTTTATATATATTTTTAPATATATVTAPPRQRHASTQAPATGSSSGTSLLWLWILLGAAALAALTGLIVHAARRRSTAAANWQSRLIDVYSKGSALHDAMSVAEAPGELAAADAGSRWADIQRRADDLTQELYSLRETVPDEGDRAGIADTLAALQAARSAMDAERAPGGAARGRPRSSAAGCTPSRCPSARSGPATRNITDPVVMVPRHHHHRTMPGHDDAGHRARAVPGIRSTGSGTELGITHHGSFQFSAVLSFSCSPGSATPPPGEDPESAAGGSSPPSACRGRRPAGRAPDRRHAGLDRSWPGRVRFGRGSAAGADAGSRRHAPFPPPAAVLLGRAFSASLTGFAQAAGFPGYQHDAPCSFRERHPSRVISTEWGQGLPPASW